MKTWELDESRRLSVAPMLDVTDRHFRYMCRLLSKKTLLYTEVSGVEQTMKCIVIAYIF